MLKWFFITYFAKQSTFKKQIMKNTKPSSLFIIVTLFVYQLLFWQEKLGLNILLFSTLLIFGMSIHRQDKNLSKAAWLSIVITWLTALIVVFHNSGLSKVVHLLSVFTMAGFVHRTDLRHTVYGFLSGILSAITMPVKLVYQLRSLKHIYEKFKPVWLYARFAIIPLAFLCVFYAIYAVANPKFADISARFASYTGEFIVRPFQYFSLEWIIFIALGFILIATVIWTPISEWFKELQAQKSEVLLRQRNRDKPLPKFTGMMDLKNEYRIAIMVIASLNALLLIVNMTDIRYIWLDFSEQSPVALSQFVHEGTYLLIISIALAMAVLLYFFRNNLNFYQENRWLRLGAYLWVIQNAMLALSVGMRNIKYIDANGLAYKRIGVMIFLILTLYGLFTMFIKVRDIKSSYYLLKTNAWALYIVMTIACFINWDVAITRYNLNADTRHIDMRFLIEDVSDKNLFVLYEHKDLILAETHYNFQKIESKRRRFAAKQKHLGWASWNYADFRNSKLK